MLPTFEAFDSEGMLECHGSAGCTASHDLGPERVCAAILPPSREPALETASGRLSVAYGHQSLRLRAIFRDLSHCAVEGGREHHRGQVSMNPPSAGCLPLSVSLFAGNAMVGSPKLSKWHASLVQKISWLTLHSGQVSRISGIDQ
jgi:hypothetical protein